MEAHFVHKSASGELAVVGVLIKLGAHNATIQRIWDQAPTTEGVVHVNGEYINAKQLLADEADEEFYHYSGSLTTPPCSEGVNWYVAKNMITISSDQLAQFEAFFDINARPVQPVNGRTVLENKDN